MHKSFMCVCLCTYAYTGAHLKVHFFSLFLATSPSCFQRGLKLKTFHAQFCHLLGGCLWQSYLYSCIGYLVGSTVDINYIVTFVTKYCKFSVVNEGAFTCLSLCIFDKELQRK